MIEYNLDAVDAAIGAVRGALAAGMDWRELGRMVVDEARAGNPVAMMIDSLQLERNQITVLLSNSLDEEEEEDEDEEKAAAQVSTKVRAGFDVLECWRVEGWSQGLVRGLGGSGRCGASRRFEVDMWDEW